MPTDSPDVAAVKPTARSRVTNGKQLFVGADGRSRQARRWRDLYRHYAAETGGRNDVMVRTLASLVVQREQVDAAVARGEPVDVDQLIKLSGEIRRTQERLGLIDDEPGEDVTEQAIAAARRHIRGEAAP